MYGKLAVLWKLFGSKRIRGAAIASTKVFAAVLAIFFSALIYLVWSLKTTVHMSFLDFWMASSLLVLGVLVWSMLPQNILRDIWQIIIGFAAMGTVLYYLAQAYPADELFKPYVVAVAVGCLVFGVCHVLVARSDNQSEQYADSTDEGDTMPPPQDPQQYGDARYVEESYQQPLQDPQSYGSYQEPSHGSTRWPPPGTSAY